MPPAEQEPGSAGDWLARARGDLALSKAPLPEGAFSEDLCFHAQQAAEKALKALHIHRPLSFRRTHDLAVLLQGLEDAGFSAPAEVKEALVLTSYASEARYPGLGEPVTAEEHRQAVALAERVVLWVEEQMH